MPNPKVEYNSTENETPWEYFQGCSKRSLKGKREGKK